MADELLPRRAVVRAWILSATLIAFFSIFIGLLQRVAGGGTDAVDQAIVAWVATHRSKLLTDIAFNLTALGSTPLLVLAVTLVMLLLWSSGRRLAAVDTVLAVALAVSITHTVKLLLGRPRPSIVPSLVQETGFSFPSGHSSAVSAFLTAIALHTIEGARTPATRATLTVFYVLLILGVGGSRIYLGVHYPSDVLAGLSLGVACGLLAYGLLRSPAIVRHLRALQG